MERPIPVAAQCKAWVCGRSLAGIAGSNPVWFMEVSLLCVLFIVRQTSLRRADHSYRGVLPSVVCLSAISHPQQWGGLGPLWLSSHKLLLNGVKWLRLYSLRTCISIRRYTYVEIFLHCFTRFHDKCTFTIILKCYVNFGAVAVNHWVFLNYNFSKEQCMLPEEDRMIETCRSVLSFLIWILDH